MDTYKRIKNDCKMHCNGINTNYLLDEVNNLKMWRSNKDNIMKKEFLRLTIL